SALGRRSARNKRSRSKAMILSPLTEVDEPAWPPDGATRRVSGCTAAKAINAPSNVASPQTSSIAHVGVLARGQPRMHKTGEIAAEAIRGERRQDQINPRQRARTHAAPARAPPQQWRRQ